MQQFPTRNKVSLALNRWTATNKLALMSVIAYYMDQDWAMWEVQLAFDDVNSLFFFHSNNQIRIIGQGSTYWSKASHTFKGSAGLFWAYRWPLTWNYNWKRLRKLLDDSGTTIHTWGVRNRVACIEKPHTMHGACHSACFRCGYEQSLCQSRYKVVGSTWARSAIWREWQHRYWEESKTSKRGQC